MKKSEIKTLLSHAGVKITYGKGENPHKLTAASGESVYLPARSLIAHATPMACPVTIALKLITNLLTQYPHLQQHDAVMQARAALLQESRA